MIPGVPSLLGGLNSQFTTPALLTQDFPNGARDTLGSAPGASGATWGVYDTSGNLVLEPDNISNLELKKEWDLLDYPVEQGAFETYNKVKRPFDIRIRMTKGGSVSDRQTFLQAVDSISGDLNFYSVTMPEMTYVNLNIENYEFRREASRGLGLLTVELKCREIRVDATQSFSNTASPAGADATSGGTVQPQDDIDDQQSSAVLDDTQ